MDNPLISVIVPVYKVEEYLDACVSSILGQTYKNLEIILVDDGSPDNCGVMCDAYAEKEDRVMVIHQDNQGLSGARNAGTICSHGEYITFVDSDDVLGETFVEEHYRLLYENEADMTIMPYSKFVDKIQFEDIKIIHYTIQKPEYCISELLRMNPAFHTGAHGKLYKRELCINNPYPQGMYFEDLCTTYRMLHESNKVVCIENSLYGYRVRNDSIMNECFNVKKMDCVEVSRQLFLGITEWYPDLQSLVSGRCLSICSNVFLQIPTEQYKDEQKILWNEIVKYRKYVLFGKRVRPKARIAAWISLLGSSVFRRAFQLSNGRK